MNSNFAGPTKNGSADVSVLMRELQCIGSDVDNFACPNCGSTDRERHLFIYISLVPKIFDKIRGGKVLHFAPERYLPYLIENQYPQEYVQADLYPRSESIVKMSMQAIEYPDEYFDVFIANHVLEHVEDDLQALREIYRIIKPGGIAVLQTPYSSVVPTTIAETDKSSPQTRLMLFGEEDHVRLYGLDIFDRFGTYGMKYIGGTHESFNISIDHVNLGINPVEPFFLFEKPN